MVLQHYLYLNLLHCTAVIISSVPSLSQLVTHELSVSSSPHVNQIVLFSETDAKCEELTNIMAVRRTNESDAQGKVSSEMRR